VVDINYLKLLFDLTKWHLLNFIHWIIFSFFKSLALIFSFLWFLCFALNSILSHHKIIIWIFNSLINKNGSLYINSYQTQADHRNQPSMYWVQISHFQRSISKKKALPASLTPQKKLYFPWRMPHRNWFTQSNFISIAQNLARKDSFILFFWIQFLKTNSASSLTKWNHFYRAYLRQLWEI